MLRKLAPYNKTIVALLSIALSVLSYYFTDASWLPFVVQAAGVLGVYQVPNKVRS